MARLIQVNEASATRRRVMFHVMLSDGINPATAEAGGQPQISIDGAVWTAVGIGVLVAVGNGRYYAELDAATVATDAAWIETRYQGATTAESPGEPVQIVGFDPADGSHWSAAQRSEVMSELDTLLARTAHGVQVSMGSNVAADGVTLDLVQGESYLGTIGNKIRIQVLDERLTVAITSDGTVPTLRIQPTRSRAGATLELAGTVDSFDDATSTVVLLFEATRAQTASLRPGSDANTWEVDLAIAGNADHVLTPVVDAPAHVRPHIG